MGLDMHLEKRTYVKNWNHQDKKDKHEITIKQGGKILEDIDTKKITNIIEEAGYWRKANHIHRWFVENIQEGNDDCKDYYVDTEDMEKLLKACEEVKKSLINSPTKKVKIKTGWNQDGDIFEEIDVFTDTETAKKLLPNQSGFFFGGVEYDEWYLNDIKYTIKVLEKALKNETGEFYYSSSW